MFNVVPLGGLSFHFKEDIFLKIGFCYFRDDLIDVPDGKVILNLIFTLKEEKQPEEIDFNDSNNQEIEFSEP